MVYLMLYVVNTMMVTALSSNDMSFKSLVVMALLTLPGWIAVWYTSNRYKGGE